MVQKKAARPTKKPAKAVKKTPIQSGHGVGRRKAAVARVWLYRGAGKMMVNDYPAESYFDTEVSRLSATAPLRVCAEASHYDVSVSVEGGGKAGQADAVKLGFARALLSTDESLKSVLRKHGLLTVDSRNKERKKYGQKAARRKFQFVKR